MQQVINCTYRGPRVFYLVSKLYPYYDTEQITVGMVALNGVMYSGLVEFAAEELTVGMLPLTGELRTLLKTYNASTGATDGSTAPTAGNVEQLTTQIAPSNGTLVQVLFSHTQPTEDAIVSSLSVSNGTLVQVLITHSQPTEAIETTITALDGDRKSVV